MYQRIVVMVMSVVMLSVVGPAVALAQGENNPGIMPPQSHAFGKSLGEWSAEWWKWALSIPSKRSPLIDPTGANCAEGQSGKVWFLAGTFTTTDTPSGDVVGTASRACSIPTGKAVLIPIINAECSTIEGNGTTEAELRSCARGLIDGVTTLNAEVDGKTITNPRQYRATSPLFTFILPPNDILGKGPGSSPSVSDGFYLLLAPLSVGRHTIHVHGEAPISPQSRFILDVSYTLTVKR